MKVAASVKRFVKGLEPHQAAWITAMVAAGHRPVMSGGRANYFAYESGQYHNGPRCSRCGQGWCWHCTSADQITPCKGESYLAEKTAAVEDAVLAQADAIRARRAALAKPNPAPSQEEGG